MIDASVWVAAADASDALSGPSRAFLAAVAGRRLPVSLPASEGPASPHAQAEDVQVGGVRGREAFDRLRNVIGRVESSWRPASAEEGFEIVRRRLFEPFAGPEQFTARDVVARALADLYRTQREEFPPDCREADYEGRIRAAYPIHPEVFDRRYTEATVEARLPETYVWLLVPTQAEPMGEVVWQAFRLQGSDRRRSGRRGSSEPTSFS